MDINVINTEKNYLIIQKMVDGGFTVSRPDEYRTPSMVIFACTTIDELLGYIKDKWQPEPATPQKCAVCDNELSTVAQCYAMGCPNPKRLPTGYAPPPQKPVSSYEINRCSNCKIVCAPNHNCGVVGCPGGVQHYSTPQPSKLPPTPGEGY